MTHNEKRAVWWKEGLFGLGTGVLYGFTSVTVGHPWDTVKTKMQAQKGFEDVGMLKTFAKTFREQGVAGLYRGAIPPLFGSMLFRSVQFGAYEAAYTYLDNDLGRCALPLTGGLQLRVIVGGFCGGIARATIETPLEYVKISRQLQRSWRLRDLYRGYSITCFRSVALLTTFFVMVDTGKRNAEELFSSPVLGPFVTGGLASTMAWLVIWPLEFMKSQVQGHYGPETSLLSRMRTVMVERGFFGLYRGLAPGIIRSFIANGASMIVMHYAQRKVTQWGLRD
ncbi:hypothetical protein EMCRGX_G025282 [Ephydatia muelleri]|eukprot:Em0021g121a